MFMDSEIHDLTLVIVPCFKMTLETKRRKATKSGRK